MGLISNLEPAHAFTVVDVLASGQWQGGRTNLQLLITIYRSKEARKDAVMAGTLSPDFIMDYLSTFHCVACTLVGTRLEEVTSPTYYPDLPRRRRDAHWTGPLQ